MPEANVLFVVAAVVIAGLAGWVAVVLKTAKEPWARPGIVAKVVREDEPPLIGADEKVETKDDSTEDAKPEAKKDDAEEGDEPAAKAKKEPEAEAKKEPEAKKDDVEKDDDDADDEKKDAKKA